MPVGGNVLGTLFTKSNMIAMGLSKRYQKRINKEFPSPGTVWTRNVAGNQRRQNERDRKDLVNARRGRLDGVECLKGLRVRSLEK
jgi:hypothetical protein